MEASWGPLGALLGFSEAQVVPNALKGHFGGFLGALGGPRTPLRETFSFLFWQNFVAGSDVPFCH